MKGKTYPIEFQQDFLERFKNSGKSLTQFCEEEGVNVKTAYSWIKKYSAHPTNQNALLLENQRLKKEKQQLIALIGRLTVTLDQLKKKDVSSCLF